MTVKRREILNGIVGLSVASYVIGYAAPIGINEMFRVAPPESSCLIIDVGDNHLIQTENTATHECVEWKDGAQLEIEDGGQLELK